MTDERAVTTTRYPGGSVRPAVAEPVRFGGWSDYGEWADHDFRDREPSEDVVVNGKRPIVVEVMTATVPITLPEEPEEEYEIRDGCRISPTDQGYGGLAGPGYMLEVDPSTLVRPYLVADWSVDTGDDLGLETVIETVQPYATLPLKLLSADQRRVYRTCSIPQSVAEVAVEIEAPIGLALVIIREGLNRGYLRVHSTAPATVDGLPSIELLRRVHNGLSRLA